MKKDLSLRLSLKERVKMTIANAADSYAGLFSMYLGEEVSTSHVLRITHVMLAFTCLVFTYGNVMISILFLLWFIGTLYDCVRAGIK
ncbi:MAG: hypothetical protein ACTTKN_03585 [Phocaeicola sp.]|uniref:hypothetical protein n=1 Tax=Phocaeicola TaxID=909656 RepID=UPI00234E8947|nr:hypothetical protein [Phocaeicola oris]MCE2615761.1 hypothetical protein [Phocaeicola oris]